MPKNRKIPRGYLSIKQVADQMDLSVVWIYKLIKANNIPTFKFGITVIKESDAEKLQTPEPVNV